MAAHMTTASTLKIQDDPEAIFQVGWLLCDVGDHEAGLDFLQRAVARGYFAASTLTTRAQFDALRGEARVSRRPGQSDSRPPWRAPGVPRRWWRTADWRVTAISLSRPCAVARTTQDGIDEDTGTRARPRRDRSTIDDDPAGWPCPLGEDVGAPDGVPPERLLSHGTRS